MSIQIQLSEEFVKETIERLVLSFRSDCLHKDDLHSLSAYRNLTHSQLSGMWILFVHYPDLKSFIGHKQAEVERLYSLAESRINQ